MKPVWDDTTLSLEAVAIHTILLDRLCLSYRPENIERHTDANGNVWCNYDLDELTKMIRVKSHNTTKKAIDELENKGYINVSRLRGVSNRYYITNLNEVSHQMTSSKQGSHLVTTSEDRKSKIDYEEVKEQTEGSQQMTMRKSPADYLGSHPVTTNDTELIRLLNDTKDLDLSNAKDQDLIPSHNLTPLFTESQDEALSSNQDLDSLNNDGSGYSEPVAEQLQNNCPSR